MAHKEGEKQVTLWVDEEEKEQFAALCKTMGTSVSNVIKSWMMQAISDQSIEMPKADLIISNPPTTTIERKKEDERFKAILKRVDTLERSIPKFDIDDLVQMKKELLDGDFGTVRYRLGVVETQVQELGGSIVWNKGLEDS